MINATFAPEHSKQIALARLDIIKQWKEFRRKSLNKLQADYDFVKLHNSSKSHLYEILGKISRGSLHRWNNLLNGSEDYTLLLPQYKYNTQCIASALRNAIIKLDMIPKIVYQDNGRAFRAKYFNDDKGFCELGFNGLYAKLGIETVFAKPYNAKAKVIERFFREFQEGLYSDLLCMYDEKRKIYRY